MIREGVDKTTELKPAERIDPTSDHIALGRFVRDDHQILLLVNVGTEAYEGTLRTETDGDWLALDPATGETTPGSVGPDGSFPLSLNRRQTRIFVHVKP